MALHDIMPFASPHGGPERTVHHRLDTGTSSDTEDTSWRAGEVLVITAQGDVQPIADGTLAFDRTLHLVAATDSAGEIQLGNLSDPTVAADDHLVACYTFQSGQEFITSNCFDTASDTAEAPTGANGWLPGDTVAIRRTVAPSVAGNRNGSFGLVQGGAGFVITRILDDEYNDVFSPVSTGTATHVVFRVDD